MEDQGNVERRIEPGTKQIGEVTIEYNSHYFKLTSGGKKVRKKRLSATETLWTLPGQLIPSPV